METRPKLKNSDGVQRTLTVELSKRDNENKAEGRETTIDRTLRLLYVTCSRAEETLALVLWSSAPNLAIEQIKKSGWFLEEEIEEIKLA
ncbi:MAG: hypothetical protein RR767_11185, partial [Acinetobacter sp.]